MTDSEPFMDILNITVYLIFIVFGSLVMASAIYTLDEASLLSFYHQLFLIVLCGIVIYVGYKGFEYGFFGIWDMFREHYKNKESDKS